MRLRFALITDVHFGPPASFDDKLRKMTNLAPALAASFVAQMNESVRPDLVVNLGDVIEDKSRAEDRHHYERFMRTLDGLEAPVLHVIGNHDSIYLCDGDLGELTGLGAELHYTRDFGPVRFVVLRTIEIRGERVTLPEEQLPWLEAQLAAAGPNVVVLMHHPASEMDLTGNRWFERDPQLCLLDNRRRLRAVLERAKNVVAVFNGHVHWNHLDVIGGIPYVTVQSLIENVDNDAPGRAARAWAIADLTDERLVVNVGGEEPVRYQFERGSLTP